MVILARLLCAAVICAVASSASAETPEPKLLTTLNEHPFTGTHEEACELHVKAHNAFGSKEACVAALQHSDDAATCPPQPVLQDGKKVWMIFTVPGLTGPQHRIGYYMIAFGEKVAANDPMRMANVCPPGSGGPAIKPLACGNYAVPTDKQPVPTPRPVPPAEETGQICSCRANDSTTVYSGVYIGGTYVADCDQPTFVPGIGTGSFIDGSTGSTCFCR